MIALQDDALVSSPGNLPGAYDCVVEVLESEWVKEIRRVDADGRSSIWNKRHFAVFLSNCGLFEIVGHDCEFSWRAE